LIDCGAAHKLHIAHELCAHQLESVFYSSLTGNCQREQIVSTEAHGLSPKRKRLKDVTTALHSAIHNNVDAVADRIDDFRKLFKGGARAVELPTTMV
jgi:hypothetical protein